MRNSTAVTTKRLALLKPYYTNYQPKGSSMAIFRASPLIGNITGTLGGIAFVNSKAGPVIRARPRRTKTTNPRTLEMRVKLQSLRHAWQRLTEEQRTAWRQSAAGYAFTNRIGVTSRLSGFNMFVKVNALGYNVPSVPLNPPVLDPPPLTRSGSRILSRFEVISGGLKTFFLETGTIGPVNHAFVYCARTFSSAPRRFWNTFKLVYDAEQFPGLHDMPDWDSLIGDPQVGEQCWMKIIYNFNRAPGTGATIASTFAITPP